MALSLPKPYKNKRLESGSKLSWWWDSHISPKNSKWLVENLEEMDQKVKRMLKLIEEGGDSFAKKAEMYYQKRPQLVAHVEEFYRMYRSLAERYDNVTGELRKNIPSDLQSQGSGVSDVGSEPPSTLPSPDQHRLGRRQSATRAAGFDVFLKKSGSLSDLGTKEGDETSTLDSYSDSDDSSINNYSSASGNGDRRGLRKKITELEAEVRKLQAQQEEGRISEYEEELRIAKEKIRFSEDVIGKLRIKLLKYESDEPKPDNLHESLNESYPNPINEVDFSEQEHRIRALKEDLKVTREKLLESEKLRHELKNNGSLKNDLQEKLGSAQKDISAWKSKYDKEKREVSKMQDRISRYKATLSEREHEIRALRETVSNANKSLSEENTRLQNRVTKLEKERTLLDDNIKGWDLRCQCLEADLRRIRIRNVEMEGEIEQLKKENALKNQCIQGLEAERDELVVKVSELDNEMSLKDLLQNRCIQELEMDRNGLVVRVSELDNEISMKDERIHELNQNLDQLCLERIEMVSEVEELRRRLEELERETEGQREVIEEGAEEKREAIRQLCFSLDHYRSGYHMLRKAFVGGKKRRLIVAA